MLERAAKMSSINGTEELNAMFAKALSPCSAEFIPVMCTGGKTGDRYNLSAVIAASVKSKGEHYEITSPDLPTAGKQ